jgi:hypothetical protein
MIGEACYEGQFGENGDKLQRMLFWSAILSGAAGHCYGADGLWQVNQPGNPFGASPLGNVWGDRPWTQARYLPGAKQLGLGARLLGRWRWWKFTSHPEWLNRHANEKEWRDPYAAGVPGEVRVVYFPRGLAPWRPTAVQRLEAGVEYTAAFYDPITGTGTGLGTVKPDGAGTWPVPQPPVMRDWLLVLETRCAFDGSN